MNDAKYERVGESVSIFLRGGKWYANHQHAGKQHRKSLRTSNKKEARRKALLLEAELLKGSYSPQMKPPTVKELAESYLAFVKVERRSTGTLERYGTIVRHAQNLADGMGVKDASGLNLRYIDEYRKVRGGAGCEALSIHLEVTVIRQMVNYALSRGMLSVDPLQGLRLRKPKPKPQPCWTWDEVQRILAASPEPERSAFALLAETGMRVGELRWLTWEDVDFARNVIHIRPKDDWQPKSGDQRAIPMKPAARTLLEALPRRGRWVITAPTSASFTDGQPKLCRRELLTGLKKVLTSLGLRGRIHTFRHAFISDALSHGTPEATVRSWVGHVDQHILRLYTHIADQDSQAKMRRLAEAQNGSEMSKDTETPHG